MLQCQNMRSGQIVHVNIITYTGSTRGRVIFPKNRDWLSRADRPEKQRDQVGLWTMILAYLPTRRSSRCIEIAKSDTFQSVYLIEPAQHAFRGQLGLAIRIHRDQWRSLRKELGCRRPIYSGGRGVNKRMHACC